MGFSSFPFAWNNLRCKRNKPSSNRIELELEHRVCFQRKTNSHLPFSTRSFHCSRTQFQQLVGLLARVAQDRDRSKAQRDIRLLRQFEEFRSAAFACVVCAARLSGVRCEVLKCAARRWRGSGYSSVSIGFGKFLPNSSSSLSLDIRSLFMYCSVPAFLCDFKVPTQILRCVLCCRCGHV